MKFLFTFFILSIINVVFSTTRQLITANGNKYAASIVSGGYYAFYNIVLIYTVSDFPLWQKCVISFICNVVGVFLVKWIEELSRKDKLWKFELTVPTQYKNEIDQAISIPHSFIELSDKHTLFNFYCENKQQSEWIKEVAKQYNAKFFVSENKDLI